MTEKDDVCTADINQMEEQKGQLISRLSIGSQNPRPKSDIKSYLINSPSDGRTPSISLLFSSVQLFSLLKPVIISSKPSLLPAKHLQLI